MQADQALLVEGTRHPRWLPFTLEHTDNFGDHRHFGESLAPNVLAGFNYELVQAIPTVGIYKYILKKKR